MMYQNDMKSNSNNLKSSAVVSGYKDPGLLVVILPSRAKHKQGPTDPTLLGGRCSPPRPLQTMLTYSYGFSSNWTQETWIPAQTSPS